jgi:hypothetical protein
MATGYVSLGQLRWQETDVADAAQRLVAAIRDAEQDARRQLLGWHGRITEVGFQFRPAPSHNAQYAASSADVIGRLLRCGRDDSTRR